MYSDVWKWAGSYRKSDKNIGVAWQKVPEEVMKLLKDGSHWVKEEVFPWDELAVRFHHRLVSIHPFPNGNGRFSRFHADLLLKMNAQKPLTWGGGIGADGNVRDLYLAALKEADERRYGDLLKLCRM
jgi:Fic-DOC domain mobile mystery protein B